MIATVFALQRPDIGPRVGPVALLPAVVAVVPALLMVTSVRFRSFRNLLVPETARARAGTLLVAVVLVVGMFLAPAHILLIVAYAYVLSAPLGVLTAPLRERLFGPESVAPRAIGPGRCSCRQPSRPSTRTICRTTGRSTRRRPDRPQGSATCRVWHYYAYYVT